MIEITLTAIYEEAEECGYVGSIAELPRATTQDETRWKKCVRTYLKQCRWILEANRDEAERRLTKLGGYAGGTDTERCFEMNRTNLIRQLESQAVSLRARVVSTRFTRITQTAYLRRPSYQEVLAY